MTGRHQSLLSLPLSCVCLRGFSLQNILATLLDGNVLSNSANILHKLHKMTKPYVHENAEFLKL